MGGDTSLVRIRDVCRRRDVLRVRGAERLRVDAGQGSGMLVELRRRPAALPDERLPVVPEGRPFVDEHLVAGTSERSPAWLSCADVIVRRYSNREPAPGVVDDLRGRFPGCLVMALTPDGRGHAVVATASGWRARLVPVRPASCLEEHVLSYVSAIHAWITAGWPPEALTAARLTVTYGCAAAPAAVRVIPEKDGEDRRDAHARVG
ncbi:hypothetical protein [Actinomadura rugatobispora]|uniref:Uncharacterized protein n=1 Tax=Actinomadura rugatobispora TaxID=1994 RepID=A0ABW1A0B2_9ACTN|nr:hypothetical protein GCM10010200_029540 [Actinomadura rugatobispora]